MEIDLLVNSAGIGLNFAKIQDGDIENWDAMINTNIKGLLYVIRSILPIMIARKKGHIINIGSIAGHDCYPRGNVYSATKFAIKAITKSMQIDLLGTGVRVSEIDPGTVHTEFFNVMLNDKNAGEMFSKILVDILTAEDVADAVLYCATRPKYANVAEMVILPATEASCNNMLFRTSSLPIFYLKKIINNLLGVFKKTGVKKGAPS
jgi:3-hydroxy acid dehydrogenase / malonic semialdehyde reductase